MKVRKIRIKKNKWAGKPTLLGSRRLAWVLVLFLALVSSEVLAQDAKAAKTSSDGTAHSGTEHGSLGELGAKLSDPTSDVWALFTEFDFNWSRGDLTDNDYKFGSSMTFQPILPFKLTKDWKVLTRPTVPVEFSAPIPGGVKPGGAPDFDYKSGLGNISLPLLFTPVAKPGEAWSVGLGPTFALPTHSASGLGTNTWEMGPAAVVSFKTKKITVGVLAQYWWSCSRYDGDASTSRGSILPFFYYNLPDAWQVGFNPTMTYNDRALSGNKWNVPIGLTVAKMRKIGKTPVKFQLGIEYAVQRQDDFGPEWRIKLNIIPVIQSLQKKPFF
jgi:hypothetical protein